MRISLLLRREPFGDLLERTLTNHWSSLADRSCAVRWLNRWPRFSQSHSNWEFWYGNIYTNVFARAGTPRASFEVLRREYGRSPTWWKRAAQRYYVSMATSKAGAPWLAQVGFACAPGSPETADTVILGGNHRLRCLHPSSGRSKIILKDGLPRRYVRNEVTLRLLRAPKAAPRLLDADPSRDWYVEDYVAGTPLNRIGNDEHAHCAPVMESLLAEVAEPGLELVDSAAWVAERISRLRILSSARCGKGGALLSRVECCLREVEQLAQLTSFYGNQIPLTDTHGDLQPANIVVAGKRSYLIDWEACSRRYAAYDWLTWATGIRQTPGLLSACAKILDSSSACWHELPGRWPGLSTWSTRRSQWALAWLLEEVIYQMEEHENITSNYVNLKAELLLSEMEEALMTVRING